MGGRKGSEAGDWRLETGNWRLKIKTQNLGNREKQKQILRCAQDDKQSQGRKQ